MEPGAFFKLMDSKLQGEWETIKITKGDGDHTCYLCAKELKRRKMKVLGYEKPCVLCFGCWGKFKEWERREDNQRDIRQPFRWRIPVNRH